ncbi:MAG: cation diffusion facilitator family transporter [Flammeovirgaceae bacterium]|nr:cation diffusion facilitator family transporter [Flammeovirgaceae bacterium]MDW8287406.1 cation diffusion facilitator family transporter [Flammeovirgaceae bacterium]
MENVLHPAYKGIKSVYVGIVANFLLAIGKAAAGWWGNSYALIADAIESLSDVLTSVVVLVGLYAAARQPDAEHPYGHGKAEPIAGVVVAISLLTAAILIARQSIENIQTPHPVPEPFTLLVLGIVILVKGRLFKMIKKTGEQIKSTSVKGDAWHHLSDAVTSLAAAIGILVAILGGDGYESADDWAALVGCFFISYNAITLFKPAFNELMDAAPSREIVEEVVEIAKGVEGVVRVGKCTVRKMGFDYFVDIHLAVNAQISVKEGHDIGHAVKDAIQKCKPMVMDVLTHIEPEESKK